MNLNMKTKVVMLIAAIVIFALVTASVLLLMPKLRPWIFYHEAPSEEFVEYFTGYFEDPESYEVTDKIGDDISDEFYDETVEYYEDGDFRSVRQYIASNGIDVTSDEYGPMP